GQEQAKVLHQLFREDLGHWSFHLPRSAPWHLAGGAARLFLTASLWGPPCFDESIAFLRGPSMTYSLPRLASFVLSACLLVGLAVSALADVPRALPAGKLPNDVRLSPPKDLEGYFPFKPPTSREAWEQRAERVKRQMLVSQGLWPLPEKTPLNAVVHGLMDQGDFTIEKVYFESFPGFHVTGSL